MPEQKQQKAPAFNPKVKDAIAALKAENNPQNLNVVINELMRSPLLAPPSPPLTAACSCPRIQRSAL